MQLSVHLQAYKLPMSHLVLVYASYEAIPWFRILFKMGLEYQPYKWLGQKYDSSRILPIISWCGVVIHTFLSVLHIVQTRTVLKKH